MDTGCIRAGPSYVVRRAVRGTVWLTRRRHEYEYSYEYSYLHWTHKVSLSGLLYRDFVVELEDLTLLLLGIGTHHTAKRDIELQQQ